MDAYTESLRQLDAMDLHPVDRDRARVMLGARHYAPWRVALRRTLAYLAVRVDPAWLTASCDVLEGYLPTGWQNLAHHELVTYLDRQGITPEHCTLS